MENIYFCLVIHNPCFARVGNSFVEHFLGIIVIIKKTVLRNIMILIEGYL